MHKFQVILNSFKELSTVHRSKVSLAKSLKPVFNLSSFKELSTVHRSKVSSAKSLRPVFKLSVRQ